jgi:hypothetical protein
MTFETFIYIALGVFIGYFLGNKNFRQRVISYIKKKRK